MRTFGGDLGILGLGNLFQVISMSAARGFLTISQGEVKKTIQFASTGIRLASGVRRALPLGQILIRMGRLTQAQLDELLAEQRQTQHRRQQHCRKHFIDALLGAGDIHNRP